MHFGEHDAGIPLDDVDRISKTFPDVPVYMYDAGHGFNCDHRGQLRRRLVPDRPANGPSSSSRAISAR